MATYTDSAGILRDGASVTDVSAAGTGVGYEDQRVFDGFGYTVSTQIIAVTNGNYLIAELANPAGSGVNYVMTSRSFSDNIVGGNAPLEYLRYTAASTLSATPTPTAVTIGNRIAGGPATTGTFRYQMGANLPTGGSVSSAGFVPTNGEELRIKEIVVIPPGSKLVYVVGGSGGGLAAAARIKMTFLFYTRAI
jgi:hypothetical protein